MSNVVDNIFQRLAVRNTDGRTTLNLSHLPAFKQELELLLLSLKSLQDEQHSDWCDLEDEHCTCGAKPRNNSRAETRIEITKIMGGK